MAARIRIIPHEAVPLCGSLEVRFPDGRLSRYFSDGAVFSVQHLFCFFEGTQFWSRTPSRSVQVCNDRGGYSVSNQF